jgi:hypothetical protein
MIASNPVTPRILPIRLPKSDFFFEFSLFKNFWIQVAQSFQTKFMKLPITIHLFTSRFIRCSKTCHSQQSTPVILED